MKKVAMLSLTAVLFFTVSSFAQKQGELDFGLAGNLFKSSKLGFSGSKSRSTINPTVFVGDFLTDHIRLDLGLSVLKSTGSKLGLPILVGGRYFFYAKDKMRMDAGADLTIGLGTGAKELDDKFKSTAPLSINIPFEVQYWPMEGGAVTGGLFYDLHGLNLGKAHTSSFGLNLGILIRLK